MILQNIQANMYLYLTVKPVLFPFLLTPYVVLHAAAQQYMSLFMNMVLLLDHSNLFTEAEDFQNWELPEQESELAFDV